MITTFTLSTSISDSSTAITSRETIFFARLLGRGRGMCGSLRIFFSSTGSPSVSGMWLSLSKDSFERSDKIYFVHPVFCVSYLFSSHHRIHHFDSLEFVSDVPFACSHCAFREVRIAWVDTPEKVWLCLVLQSLLHWR